MGCALFLRAFYNAWQELPLLSVADKMRSLLTHRDVIKSPGALLRDGKAVSAFISTISQWRPLTGSHPKLRIE